MGNGNKVFTVSYGTFSCTLEGFSEKGVSDSMGAMKAIAEYFRDLASDERYFAANVSGLDANVISDLASRNSSQKVTARTHDTKVVLSPAQPEPTGSSAPSPKACPQETPLTERARRIRALANQGSISEDENEQTMVLPTSEVVEAAPVENFFADPDRIAPGIKAKPAAQPAPPPAARSAHRKPNARINQGLKSQLQSGRAKPSSQKQENLDGAHTAQKPVEIIFDDFVDLSGKGIPKTNSAQASQSSQAATETPLKPTAAATKQPAQKPAMQPAPRSADKPRVKPLVKVVRKPERSNQAAPSPPHQRPSDGAGQQTLDAKQQPNLANGTASATQGAAQSAQAQQSVQTHAGVSSFEKSLSQLLALDEAAQNRAETHSAADPSHLTTPQHATAHQTPPSQPRQQVLREEQQDVSRLLQQTDQKMAQPGQSRRRNALAHLRAAVAANRGAHLTGALKTDTLKMSKSSALASQACLPQEGVEGKNNDDPMLKPLRLVENQRVDTLNAFAEETAEDSTVQTPMDFATYAHRVKATTLEAQIEAAASYLSLVLKRDSFARRLVFAQVRKVYEKPFHRRISIAIFNSLIKRGKINSLENGRYEICKDKIGFQLPHPYVH